MAVNPDLKVISEYKGKNINIQCECLVDGTRFSCLPSNLLNRNTICPQCAKRMMHEKFAFSTNDFNLKIKSRSLIALEEYINKDTSILILCEKCNRSFRIRPSSLLYKNSDCPYCTCSKGEKRMGEILSKMGFNCIPQYTFNNCRNINVLRFDLYDELENVAFEYNGEQHYIPVDFAGRGIEWAEAQLTNVKRRDQIKIDYCESHNIPLIIIPYWEFDNMENFIRNEFEKKGIFYQYVG